MTSAAAWSLLKLGVSISSPSSRAADVACTPCSTAGWVRASTSELSLRPSHARVSRLRAIGVVSPDVAAPRQFWPDGMSDTSDRPARPFGGVLSTRGRFGGSLPPHPVLLEPPGCDWVQARAARCGERAWTRCEGRPPQAAWRLLRPPHQLPSLPP